MQGNATPAPEKSQSVQEKAQALMDLKKMGFVTTPEFEEKKKTILAQLTGQATQANAPGAASVQSRKRLREDSSSTSSHEEEDPSEGDEEDSRAHRSKSRSMCNSKSASEDASRVVKRRLQRGHSTEDAFREKCATTIFVYHKERMKVEALAIPFSFPGLPPPIRCSRSESVQTTTNDATCEDGEDGHSRGSTVPSPLVALDKIDTWTMSADGKWSCALCDNRQTCYDPEAPGAKAKLKDKLKHNKSQKHITNMIKRLPARTDGGLYIPFARRFKTYEEARDAVVANPQILFGGCMPYM